MQKAFKLKKANILDLVFTPTFVTVIVLGFFLLGMLNYIYGLAGDLSYEKQYLAVEHALLINALHALDGNAFVIYPNRFNFSFSYSKNSVKVFDSEGEKSTAFIEDKNRLNVRHKDLLFKDTKITPIIFSKQGNDIVIDSQAVSPEFSPNGKLLSCPDILSEPLRSITIDPGHGWNEKLAKEGSSSPGDMGAVNSGLALRESEINMAIASFLHSYLKGAGISLTETRGLDADDKKEIIERINSITGDAVISIHTGSYPNQKFIPAKAYINANSPSAKSGQSRKLACNILNSLSKKMPEVSSVAIIPVNLELLEFFDHENPKRVLLKGKTAVLLELGNIQANEDNILKDKQKKIAEAIYEGIQNYKR